MDEILRELEGLVGAGGPVDAAALVAAELPAVQAAAGMLASRPIRTELISRLEAQAHIAGLIQEQLPPERMAPMQYAWKAMGLLPPEASLEAAIADIYTGQAGGFYDPVEGRLVLLDDVPSVLQVPVVRHELVHALQDQTWGLTDWLGDAGQDEDRGAAVQAVLEGHATEVMNRVTWSSLGLDELMKDPEMAQALEGLEGIAGGGVAGPALGGELLRSLLPGAPPPFLAAQLLFPYLVGASFVAGYREAHPDDPGCRQLYERPPRSTAEVLDPALWESGTFRPSLAQPGKFVPGFELVFDTALGQLLATVLLTDQGDPLAGDPQAGQWGARDRDKNVAIGAGWQGDRVAVYRKNTEGPGTHVPDSLAVVWVSLWAGPPAAQRVARALVERSPAALIDVRGSRVSVVFDSGGGAGSKQLRTIRDWR